MWASGTRGGGQIWEMLRGGGDGGDGGGEGTAAARMWWRGQARASRADEGWRCAGDEDEACRWRERAHHKREAGRVPCHPNVGRRPVASHLALELFLGHLRRGRSECSRRKCAALRARRTCGSRLPKYRRCPQPPLVPADMDRKCALQKLARGAGSGTLIPAVSVRCLTPFARPVGGHVAAFARTSREDAAFRDPRENGGHDEVGKTRIGGRRGYRRG